MSDLLRWDAEWRARQWETLDRPWDVIVVGGGVTGAGVLRHAVEHELTALLVERGDFACGTSSRSSKLVHGGLRYLAQGQIALTRRSIVARERLLDQLPGLVEPLGFLAALYGGPGERLRIGAGLKLYDALAGRHDRRSLNRTGMLRAAPSLRRDGLRGGFAYRDATTDDARLVLRLLREAGVRGGVPLNYVSAREILPVGARVGGLRIRDERTGRERTLRARLVVNATGAWAGELAGHGDVPLRLRPLRGSHLIFLWWRLPVARAVAVAHPADRRPVFVYPWEGATLLGTTDVDAPDALDEPARISPTEREYLLQSLDLIAPGLELTAADALSSFAGIRPVVDDTGAHPSKASREHAVLHDSGLVTITGGKLTTFASIARAALAPLIGDRNFPAFDPPAEIDCDGIDPPLRRRLQGRYGAEAAGLAATGTERGFALIGGTRFTAAELAHAAAREAICTLEDLMLRRTRLGLLLPAGGESRLPQIRSICEPFLPWSDAHWDEEIGRYLATWRRDHAPLPGGIE